MQMMAGDLVSQAAAFRLDVFATAVTCSGNDIAQDGVAPLYSNTVQRGQPLKIDTLPPGSYTMLVTTYSNGEATHPTGSACASETITPGAQVCFSVHIEAVQPGRCHHTETRCCGPDDCTKLPEPADCNQPICANMGDSCSYGKKATATVCGSACCNGLGGKCQSDCRITCDPGKGDCDNITGNGCEHDLTKDAANCGACGRACAGAGALNVATATCSNSLCTSTCMPGHANCNLPAANKPDDGCECATPGCCTGGACQTVHSNGLGQNYFDCGARDRWRCPDCWARHSR